MGKVGGGLEKVGEGLGEVFGDWRRFRAHISKLSTDGQMDRHGKS